MNSPVARGVLPEQTTGSQGVDLRRAAITVGHECAHVPQQTFNASDVRHQVSDYRDLWFNRCPTRN